MQLRGRWRPVAPGWCCKVQSASDAPTVRRSRLSKSGRGPVASNANQDRHAASATLHFPAGSPLFDRARAIAIQARLLVTWETSPDTRNKATAARPSTRKSERKRAIEPPVSEAQVAVAASMSPAPIKEAELVAEPVPLRIPDPVVAQERRGDAVLVAPVAHVDRVDSKSAARQTESMAPETMRARSSRGPSVEVASVSLRPQERWWPWIPTLVGSGAAVAAGICAVVARDRYNALSDKSQPFQSAQALKGEGQNWQLASFVLSGWPRRA